MIRGAELSGFSNETTTFRRRFFPHHAIARAASLACPCTLLTLFDLSFTVYFSASDHRDTMSPADATWQQLISALHASGRKAALAITGGGSGAVGELLRVPGGSRLLIEGRFPTTRRR